MQAEFEDWMGDQAIDVELRDPSYEFSEGLEESGGDYTFESLPVIRSYRDLLVWQRSMTLVELCVAITRNWSRLDQDSLGIQLRRAAISVPSNIAEGFGRNTVPEIVHRLRIAHGSLREVETQLLIAQRLQLGRSELVDDALQLTEKTVQLMHGLQKSMAKKAAK